MSRPLPPALRRKAQAEGGECVRWLEQIDDLIEQVEDVWDLEVGDAMAGGTASFVAPARLRC